MLSDDDGPGNAWLEEVDGGGAPGEEGGAPVEETDNGGGAPDEEADDPARGSLTLTDIPAIST